MAPSWKSAEIWVLMLENTPEFHIIIYYRIPIWTCDLMWLPETQENQRLPLWQLQGPATGGENFTIHL